MLFPSQNGELRTLTQWFKADKLSLNIKKTKYTVFHESFSI